MDIALRDYQLEAINAVTVSFLEGVNRQLVTLPTGSGKTIVMAALAMQFNKKTLLLAHREELITQAVEKFRLVWPEASIGVCMAERDEIDRHIVIGSIQSCSRPKRLERLKEQGFEVMMIDEAHHSSAESYQNVINDLGFVKGSKKLLIGVTATPQRADSQSLGKTFDKITFSRSIGTMIKAGYLSPVIGRKILTNFILQRIASSGGDFVISDLSEAMNTPERNSFIVDKFKTYADKRKAIAFCCDVQHCKDLSDAFRDAGIESSSVWGDMEPLERKRTLEAFKQGQIQVVASCGILTEGYDEPSIDSIIMARPTKSASLYTQCVGRGLRLWPGKSDCLVMDFTDRHNNLDSIMSLSCVIPEAAHINEEAVSTDEEKDRRPKIHALHDIDKEFDILGTARFIWTSIGDDEWSLIDDKKREIVIQPSKGGYIATLYFPDGTSRHIVLNPLPLDYCSGVCEDFARRNLEIAFADASKPWMSNSSYPTQGQINYLENQGVDCSNMNRGQASMTIRQIISMKNKQRRLLANEPITSKQKYLLNCHGVDTNNMTKLQAMQAISKIKQNAVNY
jgi:ATP-dependent helicase IRC3